MKEKKEVKTLEQRREELQSELEKATQQVYRIEGALILLNELIKEQEK